MKSIELRQIVEDNNLDINRVAKELFPTNKYPRLAFNRVASGESHLDAQQISKLAMLTGVSVSDLFNSGTWKMKSNRKGILTFQNEDYTAELDLKMNTTKIFHKKSLLHEEIVHTKTIMLSEYFEKLNSILTSKTENHE